MIIFLVLGILFGGAAAWLWYEDHEGLCTVAALASTVLVVLFLVALGSCINVQGEYGALIGTKKSLSIMEKSLVAVADAYYADAGKIGLGVDLPNAKQSTNLSDAIQVYRDTVIKYNLKVERYRSMRRLLIARPFFPPVPDELTIIQEVDFSRRPK